MTNADNTLSQVVGNSKFLLIALICTFHWHLFPFLCRSPSSRSTLLRAFGMAVIILQIFFNLELPTCVGHKGDQPWLWTCGYIFVEQVIIYWIAVCFAKRILGRDKMKKYNWDLLPLDDNEVETLNARSAYTDLTVPFRRCMWTFMAQSLCASYYVWIMNGLNFREGGPGQDIRIIDETGFPEKFDSIKWLLGVLIGVVVNENDRGHKFNPIFWHDLFATYEKKYETLEKRMFPFGLGERPYKQTVWGIQVPMKMELHIRRGLDFIINSTCYAMIMATAPLLLSVETPIDFLRDVLAFFFIIRLDDLFQFKNLKEKASWRNLNHKCCPNLERLCVDEQESFLQHASIV